MIHRVKSAAEKRDGTIDITLSCRAAVFVFAPKMRVVHGDMSRTYSERATRWYMRLWRWVTKRNWRVRAVDYNALTITLERCR